MDKKLFGTDGIRGVAGESPLDPATIFALGLCLGRDLDKEAAHPRVVIGEDTRESSPWIAETVAALGSPRARSASRSGSSGCARALCEDAR